MNIEQLVESLENDRYFNKNVTHWEVIDERKSDLSPFPNNVSVKIINALNNRGINKLYTHQASSIDSVMKGKDVVIVTPTASGKTLCYNIPVINSIIENPAARALYIFPTKALSNDQVNELHSLTEQIGVDIKTFTYDGDTPASARKAIRQAGHIVVTNPDMLHSGIMPNHTKWVKLFENLKYIVIDELHTYRGVFGSHTANVIRRLLRICEFYGSKVQFICSSATIANPAELASRLTGRNIRLIDNNGAPSGKKHIIFYNPPVVNKELGIRKSSVLESRRISAKFLLNGIQTIVFARSRLIVEILVSYLKDSMKKNYKNANLIRGYRSGYLPKQRREIEKGLRNKQILGVVSTNALELGIDIGQLQACIMCGYPGSVSSTWQQSGRAGRRQGTSAVIIIANSSPLNQYMVNHPEYFLGSSPEYGLINPDNLYIFINHLKCACFELPLSDKEKFGGAEIKEILMYLEEQKILRHSGDKWYWSTSDSFPASDISLRSASNENFVIIDITKSDHKVIGEVDFFSAPIMLHEQAIYIHEGKQYQVEELDYDDRKAYVTRVDVDYYTDAHLEVELKVLTEFESKPYAKSYQSYGDVMVTSMVTMFKKIKFDTHENLGWGQVHLPQMEMHTNSYWLCFDDCIKNITKDDLQNGLNGISNVLSNILPLYLMCDTRDINVVYNVKSPFTSKPTIFVYDTYPGGIGLAEKLYDININIFKLVEQVVNDCTCSEGCPSCVGPIDSMGNNPKDIVSQLLGGIVFGS